MRESYQRGTIVQAGRSWFLRFRERDLRGVTKHRSEKIGSLDQYPTRAKATKAADAIRKRINEHHPVVTFGELAERYDLDVMPTLRSHTQITNASNLAHLRKRFAGARLDEITPGEMELWLNTLCGVSGEPLSRVTRRHVRNLAHNLWRHAMLWGYLPAQVNPISIVRVTKGTRPKPRSKVTVDAEVYGKLLADPLLPAATKMMVRVAMTTGMGISEILGLRWEDAIDFRHSVIHVLRSADGKHVNQTKNEFRENAVPMHPDLADALRAWKLTDDGDWGGWVFGSPQTGRPYHAGIMQADHLKPAGARAGCPGLGWHSFRHTYSVAMEDVGASDRVQQRGMRHGTAEMSREYGKHSPVLLAKVRKAQGRLVRKLGAK